MENTGWRVFSHEHPVLRFRDQIGAQVTLPCFLYDEENKLIILPAFSPLASGTNMLSPEQSFLSPELRKLDLSRGRVFTISNGIMEFGTVEELRQLRDQAEEK